MDSEHCGNTIAIVGIGAILPGAINASSFWENILNKSYSITEVPPDRWSLDDYYDPSPAAPDKTYSKIGGWVQGFKFDWKKFRIPPKVASAMDLSQQWALTIAEQALADYGYPQHPLDPERTAVILGTAMGGEMHYLTFLRISFPEYARALETVEEFRQLPAGIRQDILDRWHKVIEGAYPPVTEDSMPGELANIVSGRIANVFNFRGPNFITDAACAASFAAIESAVKLLADYEVDAVLTGGVDHNMGASSFVKFCKIGALSGTGSRPFGEGADGFVMGEGAAVFLLKRLEDAEQEGDKIYAVIRGVGGSSDGKGKGITAPNPIGQQLAMRSAWKNAGLDPATATLIEAHGTSTKVGDIVEYDSMLSVFGAAPSRSIALGSVKSNIGHLKAGAGAAGLLKAALAVHHKILPPTLNAVQPNPGLDFSRSALYLNHEAREWTKPNGAPRRCGVSAYGFGGTNFHLILEEHIPGSLTQKSRIFTGTSTLESRTEAQTAPAVASTQWPAPQPLPGLLTRGMLAIGAGTPAELRQKLEHMLNRVEAGWTPPITLPGPEIVSAPERLLIDFGSHQELKDRILKARTGLELDAPQAWNAMQALGIFRGRDPKPGKIAFLFPGQGSQYLNMGRELATVSDVVAGVFEKADRVMAPILGKPLSQFIFLDTQDPQAVKEAEQNLMQTAITQPAMLTLDIAIYRLLETYGFKPDLVMGHSLGEYAALIVSGIMPFEEALEAAAARGREMSSFKTEDNGWMAAVIAPDDLVEKILGKIDGYVVAANLNSYSQSVIGGASKAVEQAIHLFQQEGYQARRIPVSHAFHTRIVASASVPLRKVLDRLHISPPRLPLVSNVTGDLYPTHVEAIKDLLQQQVSSPVQWIKGLERLYAAGARTFVEVGPKKALKGFVDDVFSRKTGIVSLFTNHPKAGELASFNQALCGLLAAGYFPESGYLPKNGKLESITGVQMEPKSQLAEQVSQEKDIPAAANSSPMPPIEVLGQLMSQVFAQALDGRISANGHAGPQPVPFDRNMPPLGSVIISGTALGLPGAEKAVMDPNNAERILRGEQFVDLFPERFRKRMCEKRITRLIKSENGNGSFEAINNTDDVIKLGGRPGFFNLAEEYGIPEKMVESLDITTQLAMAAGLDALREAGIPLVQTYRRTTTGKLLPDHWMLPEALRDETGVIFASAFPGGDRLANEFSRYYTYQARLEQLAILEDLRCLTTSPESLIEIDRKLQEVRSVLEREPYEFDRRFLFRVLAMGHSQFAEYIGARGPNTQVNAACASTTQAIAIAEDWIRAGRCRRMLVIAADNVTGDNLLEWVGAGFLALGAAAIDDRVEEAALPFDRRRHGTILGMGACALVIESEDAVCERGMRGLVELLCSESRNSAYHGSRLDVEHIASVMDELVTAAERRFGLNRQAIAPYTVFMSHETYTPARGGSASAEVVALRKTFGAMTNEVIVANTKGFTGHPMGVGIEDVIAVKILEHGIVPPVPNFKELDQELGELNLSRGGRYPVQYVLHMAAGFGSQIAMSLVRRIPGSPERIDDPLLYQRWLDDVSGCDRAELEVVKRVLRIKANGAPPRSPAPNRWQKGTGPVVRTRVTTPLEPDFHRPHPPGSFPTPLAKSETPPAIERLEPVEPAPEPIALQPSPQLEQLTSFPSALLPVTGPHPPAVEKVEASVVIPSFDASQTISVINLEDQPEHAIVDPVVHQVLALVAEKTGYPIDMLELDLDLEADLGIDTVKQAETFLALRETFEIPRQDTLQLRDYPTLAHVIQFVRQMRPDLTPAEEEIRVTQDAIEIENVEPSPGMLDPVAEKVLALVAEKTGYPKDMLELDLDLEADLGIDTVKQAETFLALRETFEIPRQDTLQLRDYPTLAHVIQFVHTLRPDLSGAMDKPSRHGEAETHPEVHAPSPSASSWSLEEADRIPRRIPVPVLRPPIEQCKPTGVNLGEHSRVVVVLDQDGVGKALLKRLEKLGASVLALEANSPAEVLTVQLSEWQAAGPVQGMYWLPALTEEPDLETLDIETWRELNRERVKNLYTTLRCLYASIAGPDNFLVSATRLGGLHGYGPDGATAPLGGAVTGFTKAFKRERSQVVVKSVDFNTQHLASKTAQNKVAEYLIAETLRDPGVVEVGYQAGERFAISLIEQSLVTGSPEIKLDTSSVFLVSGAAGSITSAITGDLAAASGGTFYLLDLVPPPDPSNLEISLFRTDREALKEKFIQDAKAAGKRPTPVAIERQIQAIEREEAALRAIEAVEASGGKAYYYSLDLLDGTAVAEVIEEIRQCHGRIDVLVHAAGVEISHSLPEKDPRQFDLVFDVKAEGFFNLLHAAKGMPIGATVAFSSVAGRFGNAGQTDYSAANDLLCKITSSMRRWRPETRGIAIDWTAWGGIGMATRGSIPKIMEMAGIEMLPPASGVPTVRRELTGSSFRGELVVAGSLGFLLEEWDEDGGLDIEKANRRLAEQKQSYLMVGRVKGLKLYGGLQVETELDPQVQPFLYDHKMDGTPLLPGVMGTEAFAELASFLAPGYTIAAIQDETFHNPFKFYRMEKQTLHMDVAIHPAKGGELLANATLRSFRQPGKAGLAIQEKVHFTANIRLVRKQLEKPELDFTPPTPDEMPIHAGQIYRVYFHGPSYQVLARAQVNGDRATGLLAQALPSDTSPPGVSLLAAPRLLELCFQTAGIWEIQTTGHLALPMKIRSVNIFCQPEDLSGELSQGRCLYAVVQAVDGGREFNAQVIDDSGKVYLSLAGYQTISLPVPIALS